MTTLQEVEAMDNAAIDPRIEILARMWIRCDPNRSAGEPVSAEDEPIATDGGSSLDGQPSWHWFIPRAEASLSYLQSAGLEL